MYINLSAYQTQMNTELMKQNTTQIKRICIELKGKTAKTIKIKLIFQRD